jgi:antitoxin component YwqK of YwqJK toxin-antitoxin module
MRCKLLILLFSTIYGFSQEIKYNLLLKDSCSNQIENSFNYHLERNGTEYTISDFANGTILLSEKGEYNLIATEIGETHKIIIDKLINSDTLILPKSDVLLVNNNVSFKTVTIEGIGKIERPKTHTYKFMHCENICNGIETDYYSNGTIRLTGEFKNGLVIGELKRYYQSGKIKEISIYDKDGFWKETFFFEESEIIKKE